MLHHHTRYDDLEHLKAELEQEKRYRETIEWSNQELERSITELEAYLRELEESSHGADDNEWKVRFESQGALNKQLQEQKDWLETELADARRKLTTGSYPEAMNFNLDALNEPELLRLVKHLERMRNDFYSTLRDTEWKLDKESKEFHHFDEMRRVYKADLKHANQTIERMRLSHVLDPSGMISPIYPPGYFRWLDSHTPLPAPSMRPVYMDGSGGKGGGGGGGHGSPTKSPKKSSKSKDKSDGSQSPTRSKSRADKKMKKKEEPPAEVPAIRRNSKSISINETDNGNATEGSGGEQDSPANKSDHGEAAESVPGKEGSPKREGSKEPHDD